MADIVMCDSPICPMRERCQRHAASGTKADDRQYYFAEPPGTPLNNAEGWACRRYRPTEAARRPVRVAHA